MANQTMESSFSSLDTRVKWVMAAFTIYLILSVASFVSDLFQAELVSRAINGGGVTVAEASANDDRQAVIAFIQEAVLIATAITFFFWIHRAYKNLYSFGSLGLRFSPGWSIGWFFVPIASLFRPYQVMSEIGSNSEADPTSANLGVSQGRVPLYFGRMVVDALSINQRYGPNFVTGSVERGNPHGDPQFHIRLHGCHRGQCHRCHSNDNYG